MLQSIHGALVEWLHYKVAYRHPWLAICNLCEDLDLGSKLWCGPNDPLNPRADSRVVVDTSGHQALRSMIELKKSASGCHCCNLIYDAIRTEILSSYSRQRQSFAHLPINVYIVRRDLNVAALKCVVDAGAVQVGVELRFHHDDSFRLPWWDPAYTFSNAICRPERNSRSDKAIRTIANWMNVCRTHNSCRRSSDVDTKQLPDRLLEVGPVSRPWIRLVDLPNIASQYIALSYTWGTEEQFCLRRSTFKQFQSGINEKLLPATFRDAIFLARRLGIAFVWIDALCIIQDSFDDWDMQTSKMGMIYRNAELTVCASSTKCVFDGSLGRRAPIVAYCGPIKLEDGSNKSVYISRLDPTHSLERQLRDEPLMQRGWCFQERLLSRRKVYLAKDQMYWQCQQSTLMEAGLDVAASQGEIYDFRTFGARLSTAPQMHDSNILDVWNWMVTAYAKTTLSRQTDRLPAMSGLAREFSALLQQHPPVLLPKEHHPSLTVYDHREKQTFLAGHWLSGLPLSLQWHNISSIPSQLIDQSAPSWSWASAPASLQFASTSLHYQYLPLSILAGVVNYDVKLKGSNPYGEVANCWLQLRGPVFWTDVNALYSSPRRQWFHTYPEVLSMFGKTQYTFEDPTVATQEKDVIALQLSLDVGRKPLDDDTKVGLLAIMRQRAPTAPNETISGIVIAQCDASGECRRIGEFQNLLDVLDSNLCLTDIKLV